MEIIKQTEGPNEIVGWAGLRGSNFKEATIGI